MLVCFCGQGKPNLKYVVELIENGYDTIVEFPNKNLSYIKSKCFLNPIRNSVLLISSEWRSALEELVRLGKDNKTMLVVIFPEHKHTLNLQEQTILLRCQTVKISTYIYMGGAN